MIKGTGYYYNGANYETYFKGQLIGRYKTRNQAWYAISARQF